MSLSERSSAASKRPRVTIVGSHSATEQLRQLIETIAHSNSTALITGESGTGKELVAQALHAHGPRAQGSFVPINCGAIPRELIESELFGHRKGAFTGAFNHRVGRFELAEGGTLFLDEIGDLPLDMQVKLLRVLQERRILPVGADSEVPIDVRVVAATHKDLEAEVSAGRFREDLYYRINVLPIATTPLRERSEDVLDLLKHYANHHAQASKASLSFTPRMLDLLTAYDWPGNVRELSNLMDRLSTLFPGSGWTWIPSPLSCCPRAWPGCRPSSWAGWWSRVLSRWRHPRPCPRRPLQPPCAPAWACRPMKKKLTWWKCYATSHCCRWTTYRRQPR